MKIEWSKISYNYDKNKNTLTITNANIPLSDIMKSLKKRMKPRGYDASILHIGFDNHHNILLTFSTPQSVNKSVLDVYHDLISERSHFDFRKYSFKLVDDDTVHVISNDETGSLSQLAKLLRDRISKNPVYRRYLKLFKMNNLISIEKIDSLPSGLSFKTMIQNLTDQALIDAPALPEPEVKESFQTDILSDENQIKSIYENDDKRKLNYFYDKKNNFLTIEAHDSIDSEAVDHKLKEKVYRSVKYHRELKVRKHKNIVILELNDKNSETSILDAYNDLLSENSKRINWHKIPYIIQDNVLTFPKNDNYTFYHIADILSSRLKNQNVRIIKGNENESVVVKFQQDNDNRSIQEVYEKVILSKKRPKDHHLLLSENKEITNTSLEHIQHPTISSLPKFEDVGQEEIASYVKYFSAGISFFDRNEIIPKSTKDSNGHNNDDLLPSASNEKTIDDSLQQIQDYATSSPTNFEDTLNQDAIAAYVKYFSEGTSLFESVNNSRIRKPQNQVCSITNPEKIPKKL